MYLEIVGKRQYSMEERKQSFCISKLIIINFSYFSFVGVTIVIVSLYEVKESLIHVYSIATSTLFPDNNAADDHIRNHKFFRYVDIMKSYAEQFVRNKL